MPGNRALFDRAMEQSREAARLKQWEEALKQAVRALQEFPQDAGARSSVAVALFNTGKNQQALQLFEELRRSDQNNPFFLEYLAQCYERVGDGDAAVAAYVQLADLQQGRRLGAKAAEALGEVLRLRPGADEQRERLARLLEESGARGDAAGHYLELARRRQGRDLEQASALAEHALELDPASREAKELIAALHGALADVAQARIDATHGASGVPAAASSPSGMPSAFGATGGLRGHQFAVDKVVAQAQERQEAGDMAGAMEGYERAVGMGCERSDVFYSLGLLYQEAERHEDATRVLARAAQDEEYALSAHYALGTSFQALGRLPQAVKEYEETISLLPLESIGKTEAEDMIQMYEAAAGIYVQMNDIARAASLYSTLANFLGSKRWGKERADEFRQRAKELTERNMFAKLRSLGTGALAAPAPDAVEEEPPQPQTMPETWGKIKPITEFLRPRGEPGVGGEAAFFDSPGAAPAVEAPELDPLAALDALPAAAQQRFAPLTPLATGGLDEVAERYVVASEKYVDQNLMLAAVDACLEVIRLSPDYLPIHLRLGEIYERDGRTEEALTKYQLLVDTYTARGEAREAIPVYFRLIELSPDTINARARLSDLLRQEGRLAEAAEQVGLVASSYFRMGQTNKALEEYRRGLQWAPESAALHQQYAQGLLRLERYEAALTEFRRALELEPDNLANVAGINIALALIGDQPLAMWQSLATLLEQLRARPQQGADVQAEYRSALLVADEPVLHYTLAVVQQHAGQHQSALMELEQAEALLEEGPDPLLAPALVHQAMADSFIALGQADEARAQLQKCLAVPRGKVSPELARYSFATPLSQGELVRRMAEAYAATGDLVGAEQALLEARQHIPYDRAIYTKLADVYFRQGKLAEALAQLDDLATYYEGRQDLDRAIETIEDAVKLAPNNIALGNRLAKLNIRRGYLDKGVAGLVRVAEQQRKAGQLKDAVQNLQQAAEVHWTLGQHEKAREIYDKIIHIAPNDVEARQWLAFMYTLAGRSADAVAEKKQIVRILLQQRDLDNAIAEMHQIYGLDQNDADNLYQLGDALMRRQEYDQAMRIYSRLAKMPHVETERVEALQAAAKRMMEQSKG
jgi:tetratricopeptide (TPR) repeat protein